MAVPEEFWSVAPYNSTWYGCETTEGATVWSNNVMEIVHYPTRKRYQPILEERFGDIRTKLIETSHYQP